MHIQSSPFRRYKSGFDSQMLSKLSNINIYLLLFFTLILVNSSAKAVDDVKELADVGIKEHLGDKIPLDLEFTDSNNEKVKLGDFFLDNKPVILNLVYYSCPRVCNYAIGGVVNVVNMLTSLHLGKDFKILTVSFDERDSYKGSKEKIDSFFKLMNQDQSPNGNWHFLTGDKESIRKLTQLIGFNFKRDGDEFAHPTSLIVLSPKGKVTRYLYGIQQNPQDLRLALLEASKGQIGQSKLVNKVLLYCYHFDPVGKKYALKALNVVKAAGMLTLISLGVFLTYYWRREDHTNT